jgi:hypothetical protein
MIKVTCPDCDGDGWFDTDEFCVNCTGDGFVESEFTREDHELYDAYILDGGDTRIMMDDALYDLNDICGPTLSADQLLGNKVELERILDILIEEEYFYDMCRFALNNGSTLLAQDDVDRHAQNIKSVTDALIYTLKRYLGKETTYVAIRNGKWRWYSRLTNEEVKG